MSVFTAGNGIRVEIRDLDDRVASPHLMVWKSEREQGLPVAAGEFIDAIREFFQDALDQQIGRWRWPEDPDYVVYERRGDGYIGTQIRVLRESDCSQVEISREHVERYRNEWDEAVTNPHWHAARAYFDAHPEPKPWNRPTVGDHWVLTVTDSADQTVDAYTFVGEVFELRHNYTISPLDPRIIDGRRIWPEVAS